MPQRTVWVTGFLTQLILAHLRLRYPSEFQRIDFRALFGGIEGYEGIKDPQSILQDSHSWIPEEVLREVLRSAEELTGRKDIALEASIDYFSRAGDPSSRSVPSIFEIIARTFNDVRTVVLSSGLWASAYTSFMRLQAIAPDADSNGVIILSHCEENCRLWLSTHYMLKGNYEGFVRLYEFVEDAVLEEDFLQHRIQDIAAEFDGYFMEEDGNIRKILHRADRKPVAEFMKIGLETDRIPVIPGPLPSSSSGPREGGAAGEETGSEGAIASPEPGPGGRAVFRLLSPRPVKDRNRWDGISSAWKVIRGGTLRGTNGRYTLKEGALFEAPYSRYRFQWRERGERPSRGAGMEARFQETTFLLFAYLQQLKTTQQRLLAYAAENKALSVENVFLRREAEQEWSSGRPMGKSQGMQAVLSLVRQVAPTESTVLITGETGTGKEVIARTLHQGSSRRERRFVAVNCGAIPEGLMESELFGHEKGAFTGALTRKMGRFEWAQGGTLFLDEIGEIPPSLQVKLLRVLQEREIQRVGGNEPIRLDVRIIAATNQDLKERVESGVFRKDLFYRLHVIPIPIPPLRERREDIRELADYFLAKFTRTLGKKVRSISPLAHDLLRDYPWPGNIRELENIIERAVTLIPADQAILEPVHLPLEIRRLHTDSPFSMAPNPAVAAPGLHEVIDRIEWNTLLEAMKVEDSMDSFLRKIEWAMARRAISEYGSKTEAARVLKRTYRWIRKLEKEMEDRPPA